MKSLCNQARRHFSSAISVHSEGEGFAMRKFLQNLDEPNRFISPWHDISLKHADSKDLDYFNTVFEITRYAYLGL